MFMKPRNRSVFPPIAVVCLGAAACARDPEAIDPPPATRPIPITAAEVSQTVEARVADHLRGVEAALRAVSDSALAQQLGLEMGEPAPGTDPAADLAQELGDRLFAPGAVEHATDHQLTYRVDPARVCAGEAGPDEGCAELLTEVPFRLVVSAPLPGQLAITVEVGAARHQPLTLRLAADRIVAEADLAEAKASFDLVAAALELETEGLPSTVQGRLSAALVMNAARDFTFELRILDALRVLGGNPDFELGAAARATPIASLRLDGNAAAATADLDTGAIDLAVTGAVLSELTGAPELASLGRFAAHLDGASARLTFTGEDEALEIESIGLGAAQSRITLDGAPLVAVDLNALHGRRFDLSLSAAEGGVHAAVSPAFDLAVSVQLGALIDAGLMLPSWLRSDLLRVTLDGAAAPAFFAPQTGEPVLHMSAGNLLLSSDARGAGLTVPAGSCLWVNETGAEDAHPLDVLTSAGCP